MDIDQPQPTFPSGKLQGRPRYVPTEEDHKKVGMFASAGIPEISIAVLMNVSIKTFRKAYRHTLIKADAAGVAHVFGKWRQAIEAGEAWAIRLKLAQYGITEVTKTQNQALGADGKPVDPSAPTAVYVIKDDELKLLSQELDDEV